MSLCRIACLTAVAFSAIVAAGAPAASAAEGECPNEAIRVEQGSTHLPECRAWELVGTPDKNQNGVLGPAYVSEDGDEVLYSLGGPTADDPSGGQSILMATRTAAGWTNRSVLPPIEEMPDPVYILSAVSADMRSIVASAINGPSTGGTTRTALVRLGATGGQTVLYPFPRNVGFSGIPVVASDDAGRLLVNVPPDVDPTLPGSVPGVSNLYDFGSGTPELVGAMPGTDLAPACGAEFASDGVNQQSERWVSSDGTHVFFATRGNVCSDPLWLYRRDIVAGQTEIVSPAPIEGAVDNGIARFLGAAANGSWAIYTSTTSYDPRDAEDGENADRDVYRWNAATDVSSCLTCIGETVEVIESGPNHFAVSEDGSNVYFASERKLADAPTAADSSTPNVYEWRLGHTGLRFVARIPRLLSFPALGGYLTPNGDVLLFHSAHPSLDALTGSANGGFEQFYRYDSRGGGVSCLSCPAIGAATGNANSAGSISQGIGAILARSRPASDDGDVVFFTAIDPLTPEDENSDYDLYRWRDGGVRLITRGDFDYPIGLNPYFVTTTADGDVAFFTDFASGMPGAGDGNGQLYAARVGGGFPTPPEDPEPCREEACFGPQAQQPPGLAPGTDLAPAATNVSQARRKARGRKRCGKGRRVVRREGRGRCVRRDSNRGAKRRHAHGNGRAGR